jgi:hypothetical protein
MAIYSKANLEPYRLAACDRETFVEFLSDGRSVGANKRSVLIVGAVAPKVRGVVPVAKDGEGIAGECTLGVDACKKLAAALPADKLFGGLLEHLRLDATGGLGSEVKAQTTDGRRTTDHTMKDAGRRLPATVIEQVEVTVSACNAPAVLNGKRLEVLLTALRKACPDRSGETPVWLWQDSKGNVVLGTVDYKTGQAAAGAMRAYSGESAMLPEQLKALVIGRALAIAQTDKTEEQSVIRASRLRRPPAAPQRNRPASRQKPEQCGKCANEYGCLWQRKYGTPECNYAEIPF